MADEQPAVADSAPVVEAAPVSDGAAADPASVTHGDAAEPTTTDDQSAESPDSDPTDADDPADDPSEDDSPEEAKSKAQRRRERRQQREAAERERIAKDAVEAYQRQQEQATQQREQQAKVAQAKAEREKALAQFKGEDGEPERLRAEIDALNRQLRDDLVNPAHDFDTDAVLKQVAEKEARLGTITQARAFEGEIARDIWNGIEAHLLSPLQWPELADPTFRQRYVGSEGGIAGALGVAREAIVAAKDAEKDAALKAQADKHATELKALEADRNAWRVRAGGSEAVDTSSGGTASPGGVIYTRERLRQMMQSSEGMAEYRRNRAEIARQEAAGLIR